ncbi:MAG: PIG-L deacetylase family protein [Patescibacteria group bacterium]
MGDEARITVLALGAHPDDLEFMAGGTLANFARAGHRVVMATATNGNQGHMVIMPPELAAIRREEAARGAAVIGAAYEGLGIDDEFLTDSLEDRMKVIELFRRVQPDLVITNPPDDYHPDHRACFQLVFDASFVATVPHISDSPRLKAVPQIYTMTPVGGIDAQPEFYIDITETIGIKLEALGKHESQVVWLKEHDNFDLVATARAEAAHTGFKCGVAYAEGFRRVHRYPGIRAQRLLPY